MNKNKEVGESIKIRTRNWLIWGARGINKEKKGGESIKIRRRNWLI